MNLIKKYWFLFIIGIVVIAVLLNFILIIPAFTPIVGDNRDWLLFFGSIIGAAASFAMVFFTAETLKQNEKQLNELKRQWEEEHKPYLSCQLVSKNDYFLLRIFNSGKVAANNVSIKLNNYLSKEDIFHFKELQEHLEKHTFIIPPMENIYFRIWITAFAEEEQLPDGYIEVTLKTNNIDFGTFKLFPKDYAFVLCGDKTITISEKLDNVADKIKNQKVILEWPRR